MTTIGVDDDCYELILAEKHRLEDLNKRSESIKTAVRSLLRDKLEEYKLQIRGNNNE